MLNKKWIVIIICTISIFIITKSCTNFFSEQIRNDIKNENEKINQVIETVKREEVVQNEYVLKYKDDWTMIINYFLRRLISYDEMSLSQNFINKYPQLDNFIEGKCKGKIVDNYFDNYNEDMENIITVTYKTGNDYEEIAYQLHYIINNDNELDDIEILDSRVYRNADGDYPKYTFYKTYYQRDDVAIYCLTIPKRSWDEGDVPYLTDNYINNHKDYKTESILPWKEWLYVDEGTIKQDESNNRVWYVEAVNTEEVRKYKIEFIIDERGYIDDYMIEEIERKEIFDKESVEYEYRYVYS